MLIASFDQGLTLDKNNTADRLYTYRVDATQTSLLSKRHLLPTRTPGLFIFTELVCYCVHDDLALYGTSFRYTSDISVLTNTRLTKLTLEGRHVLAEDGHTYY